jgi:hypothetical protein
MSSQCRRTARILLRPFEGDARYDFAGDIEANHVRVVDDEAVVDVAPGWPCDGLNAAEFVSLPDAP